MLILVCQNISATPDLTVTQFGFNLDAVNKGGYVLATAVVQNIGTSTSFNVKTSFHLYKDGDLLNRDNRIGYVSLHELDPSESDTLMFLMAIPQSTIEGTYKVGIWVDNFQEESEIVEDNNAFYGLGPNTDFLYVEPTSEYNNKSVYPIIFIHGLGGNDTTWYEGTKYLEDKYGYINGGIFDYCLNPDGDVHTSDYEDFYTDFTFTTFVKNGDFYFVNFDVNKDGDLYPKESLFVPETRSNQSAIVKQGRALGAIIDKVIELTNKEKVILVGHSMGGLAAREYLQNPLSWQDSSKHRVAKLHTTDTPHGGSNDGSLILDIIPIYDNFSEAVRDLRYDDPHNIGTYLDGGFESDIQFDYYNSDVNCNGTLDYAIGLNEKSVPTDLSYSCSIALRWDFLYDVVDEWSANINEYLSVDPPLERPVAPIFYIDRDHRGINKDVPGLLSGLDQQSNLAYDIDIGSICMEFATEQGRNMIFQDDADSYSFTLDRDGEFTMNVFNLSSPLTSLLIFNDQDEWIGGSSTSSEDFMSETLSLRQGSYHAFILSTLENDPIIQAQDASPYYVTTSFTPFEPLVSAFSSDKVGGCSPLIVNYDNQSTGNYTHIDWIFEGGSPQYSSQSNPIVEYSNMGSYRTSLIISNDFQRDTIVIEGFIDVLSKPDPKFILEFISVNEIQLSIVNPSSNYSYEWQFGDGNNSTGQIVSHVYETSGNYVITLEATNECGTSREEQSLTIIPFDLPVTAIIDSDVLMGCIPLEVTYSLSLTGNPSSILWTFEGGTPSSSTEINPIITYNEIGDFIANVAVSNSTYSDSAMSLTISVNDIPDKEFESELLNNYEVAFSVIDPDDNDTYEWDFGDGNVSSGERVMHTYGASGTYRVSLTSQNLCGSSFIDSELEIRATSTLDEEENISIIVSPNPSKGILQISCFDKYSIESIDIISIDGKQLECDIAKLTKEVYTIDCSGLDSGLYIARAKINGSYYLQTIYLVE